MNIANSNIMEKRIWKKEFTLKGINNLNGACMPGHLGIEITEMGDDFLRAKMPVNNRTRQPMGLLHGGASVVLAETIGSVAGLLCIEDDNKTIVGVEINANHLRSARKGFVTGTAKPVKIGRTLQIWNIEIEDEEGRLTCVSRFTAAVVDMKR
ncbi:MAG: hotdog fold thioesterase [Bacteroidota bacterium]